jgi:RND superfamily putative drug exporter
VIAFLTLIVIGTAGGLANALLVLAAKAFGFQIDDTVTGLLPVVAFGVGTDYVVFLIYRYRERLRQGEAPKEAMAASIAKVGEAITSSAFAVTVSLGALLLSTLGTFRVLGPALAGTVLLMLAVGLTFVPAVLVLAGRKVFWPSKSWQVAGSNGTFGRIGGAVSRRPARMAVLAAGLLAVLAIAAAGYHADYNQNQSSGSSESGQAVKAMTAGFPVGTLYPTQVVVKSADGHRIAAASLRGLRGRLAQTPGVGQVLAAQIDARGDVASIDVLLKASPFSASAMNAVEHELIPNAHRAAPTGTIVRVGGDTAAYVDAKAAMSHDMEVIFPVAGLLIGLVLALMLRSLIASLFVMASVVLGFGATLGASVLVFQGAGGDPGLLFSIPIVVYLFVASMGSDYAILMISRIREELAAGAATRDAARRAVRQTGPAVTSAGLVLAGSFAALTASASLAQIGFAVAIGVMLVSFVMALVLVPSLTVLLGRRAFWPGQRSLSRGATSVAISSHRT